MSDQADSEPLALAVVGGVVAAVLALVIALAVWKGLPPAAGALAEVGGSTRGTSEAAGWNEHLFFEADSVTLPVDAAEVLGRAADGARANDGLSVLIIPFQAAGGNAERAADVAAQRALAVRHALEAEGVAPGRLSMKQARPAMRNAGTAHANAVLISLE